MSQPTAPAGSLHVWEVQVWDGDRYFAIAPDQIGASNVLAEHLEPYDEDGDDIEPVQWPDERPFTLTMVDGWDYPEEPEEYRAAGFTVDESAFAVTGTCRQWGDFSKCPCLLSCPG